MNVDNIDESYFDYWLQHDITKIFLELCRRKIEFTKINIVESNDFSDKGISTEIFGKGGIYALENYVLGFDYENVKEFLEEEASIAGVKNEQ